MTVAASEDIAFVDRLLESWAAWARNAGLPRCASPSIKYSSGRDCLPHVLAMSDDSFAVVDRAVAQLSAERKHVVRVHYCREEHESRQRKAMMCGITMRQYNARLRDAQLDVYDSLVARVEALRFT
jgi:hypothetical protein